MCGVTVGFADMPDSNVFQSFLKNCHYVFCFITFLITVSTVGNFQLFISKQTLTVKHEYLHGGDTDSAVLCPFLWDFALICLFIVQHSLMATSWFKSHLQSWFRITVSERLIYLTMTCTCLMVMIIEWQSIPQVYLWYIDTHERTFLWTFFLLCHFVGWLLIGLEVMLMDVGELLGFTQVYNYYNGLTPPLLKKKAIKLREIYSRMRHPGAVILTTLLWFHPLMTLDRVLLASVFTSYIIGKHSLEDSHCDYAEKHFYSQVSSSSERKSSHSHSFEYVEQ